MRYILLLFLASCAQSASQTATDASLNQVASVEAQIKKECPTAKINDSLDSLRASIKTQLAVCESEKQTLRERNNTLAVIILGILIVLGVANWAKIKRLF